MKIVSEYTEGVESYDAHRREETAQFMMDIMEVCNKHGMCIVPTYEGEIDFHDHMRVVQLDKRTLEYLKEKVWCIPVNQNETR